MEANRETATNSKYKRQNISGKMQSFCQDRNEAENYTFSNLSMIETFLKAYVSTLKVPFGDALIRMKGVWQWVKWRLYMWRPSMI